jgi:hypothetical protein
VVGAEQGPEGAPEKVDEKELIRSKIRYQKRALFYKNATL